VEMVAEISGLTAVQVMTDALYGMAYLHIENTADRGIGRLLVHTILPHVSWWC
jgi:hypothetical protein